MQSCAECLFITTTDELAYSSDGKEGILLMSRTGKNFIWWTAMERNKSCRNCKRNNYGKRIGPLDADYFVLCSHLVCVQHFEVNIPSFFQ